MQSGNTANNIISWLTNNNSWLLLLRIKQIGTFIHVGLHNILRALIKFWLNINYLSKLVFSTFSNISNVVILLRLSRIACMSRALVYLHSLIWTSKHRQGTLLILWQTFSCLTHQLSNSFVVLVLCNTHCIHTFNY